MIIGANPFTTSAYGNIVRQIASTLSLKHKVLVYGQGWLGTLCNTGGFQILPTQITGEGKEAGGGALRAIQALYRYVPQTVITVGDMLTLEYLSRFRKRPYWIAYFPVDSEPHRMFELQYINRADIKAVPAKFGVEVLKKYHGIDAYYIPHAVSKDFHPMSKKKARANFNVSSKDFIFGFVGTNTRRKNVNVLMEAFANEFKGEKNVKLWLHCPKWDALGWNIPILANNLGIAPQVLFSPWIEYFSYSPMEMNMVYNSFDVLTLVSGGEGFGMPIAESQACGVPSIVTDYSANPEVGGIGATKIPVASKYLDGFGTWKAIPSIPHIQKAMRKYYENASFRERMGKRAIKSASRYEYSTVMAEWLTLFDIIPKSKEFQKYNKYGIRTVPKEDKEIKQVLSDEELKGT